MADSRPSALPRLEKCPASGALPQIQTPDTGASTKGTTGHDIIATVARGGEGPPWVRRYLDELLDGAEIVGIEKKLSAEGISGSADVVARTATAAIVPDHKTGRTQVYPDSLQLSFYALAAAAELGLDEAVSVVGQLDITDDFQDATWVIRRLPLDSLDLATERGRVRRTLRMVDEQRVKLAAGATPDVREGDHCDYCPAFSSCPAKTTGAAIMLGEDPKSFVLTRENAGAVHARRLAAQEFLDRIERAEKELLKTGPIDLLDGRQLWAVEKSREGIEDIDGAVRAVAELFGEEAAAGIVEVKRSISKKAIEDLAKRACTEKRGGTKAAIAAVDHVRSRGVMKNTNYLAFEAREKKAG